jgi:hypothetical protein
MVGYRPRTAEVVRFHNSRAKIKIVCSPARTSKSYAGAYDALPDCFPNMLQAPDGKTWPINSRRIWIVAPKYQLAKEFDYLWEILVDRRAQYGLTFYQIEKAQNAPDQGHMRIVLDFGNDAHGSPVRTTIEVRSAANMESIQADQADVVLMSEAADQPAEVWEKYVSTRYGRAILPTTPKINAEWLRVMMDSAEENPHLSIENFQFDGTCNPTYDWGRYWREHAQAESRASATPDIRVNLESVSMKQPPSAKNGHDCFRIGDKCWASRDPRFAEQFMGRWTQMEGRVLPFRNKPNFPGQPIHVIDRLPSWVHHAAHYISVDHGYDDPSAVLWFAVSLDGTVVLYDMIYERGLTPSELASKIKARQNDRSYWLGRHGLNPPKIEWIAGDPQNPNVRAEMRRVGLNVLVIDSKRQRDRKAGRLIFQDYLSDDPILKRPKFYAHRSCTAAIDEYRLLRRKPNRPGEEAYVGADHAYDATRYFLMALPKGKRHEKPKPIDLAVQAAQASGAARWKRERRFGWMR